MTPVDIFRAWLIAAKIEYREMHKDNCIWFEIEAGYAGFVSTITFDENKNLHSISATE